MNYNAIKKMKSLLPYFLLALAVIIANRAINELDRITSFIALFWGIVLPFFYGFVTAYIINIPCSAVQRLLAKSQNSFINKRKRVLSIVMVLLIILAIIAVALSLIVPAIADSIALLVASLPGLVTNIMQLFENVNEVEIMGFNINLGYLFHQVQDFIADFSLGDLVLPSLGAIVDASTTIFGGVFTVAIAFISSVYILFEKEKFKRFVDRFLKILTPQIVYRNIIKYANSLNRSFRQYVRTQTIDGVILGGIATIVLAIMGSPYFLILGIMLGVVNYIPYFGSIFGTLIACLVVAFTQGITMGLIAAAVLFVVQQIDANIIQPKLMSGSFSLSPLLVIVSITIGGSLAGIFGMLIAIPIVAVMEEMLSDFMTYVEKRRFGVDGGVVEGIAEDASVDVANGHKVEATESVANAIENAVAFDNADKDGQ